MAIDIRQECSKAHDEALLQQILKQSMGITKLIALLQFNGVEVLVSHKPIASRPSTAFVKVSKEMPCFIFVSIDKVKEQAKYHQLSFQEALEACLFHEAGHIVNYLKLFHFTAPVSDEVAAWTTGFWLYKKCFNKAAVPSSIMTMAKTCLASYGIDASSKAAVNAYQKEGKTSKRIQQQELSRRSEWEASQVNKGLSKKTTFREWLNSSVFIPRRCTVSLLKEANPYPSSSEACPSQTMMSLLINFIKFVAKVSVIPRSRPPPADCRTAVRLFNRSSQPK